jgi:hypothetical protein
VPLIARSGEHPVEFYDADVQRLVSVEWFAFGGIGYAGMTSVGEKAFGALVKKKEAIRYILAAFDYGNPEARCYALVALRESSPKLFSERLASFRKQLPKKITTMCGCIVSEDKPSDVLAAIEAGKYAEYFKQYEKEG